MKKSKIIGTAIATSFILLGATAIFAQQPNGQHNQSAGQAGSTGNQVHQMYIDENGDGINDNMNYMHQGAHNGGMMHNQNQSGAGHQSCGQWMYSGHQGMHNQGMYRSGMGHQEGMGYHGGMSSSSGMGGGHASNGSMGRH